jgi:hypothetical protein
MIQRIQTIYLALVIVLTAALFFVPVYGISAVGPGKTDFYSLAHFPKLMLAMFPLVLLAAVAIFSFKNRKRQMLICRIGVVFSALLVTNNILFAKWYASYLLGSNELVLGFGTWFLPANIVLFSLAGRAVKKDEELVRSADRLR